MEIDLNEGDIILTGKFKNKPVVVYGFGEDANNHPVALTKKGKKINILSVRIKKLIDRKKLLDKLHEKQKSKISKIADEILNDCR
jgi:thioredoxin reductase